MVDLGHWKCDISIPDDPFGFIYEITNLQSGKKYIGKCQMTSILKLPPLKGKKRRRHKKVETKWREYTGSSNELNNDIEKLGKEHFEFKIISFHPSKSALSYHEAKMQFGRNVLLCDNYYNNMINLRISKVKE